MKVEEAISPEGGSASAYGFEEKSTRKRVKKNDGYPKKMKSYNWERRN